MTPEQEERLAASRRKGGHRKVVITDVEDLLCPDRVAGTHVLTNKSSVTFCVYCSRTWADLDQEMRSNGRV